MATVPAPSAQCTHCGVPISDPTTQRVHGSFTYCCANCSAALEQAGPGSDPHSPRQENRLRCARCSSPIVDESTMEARGDQAFCCRNCAAAHQPAQG